jgi:carbon monoxide dehydrogenase subunit G
VEDITGEGHYSLKLMAITIEKTFQIPQPPEKVWEFLSDPRKVATCVPGAEITEQLDESNYKGAISVKVGPSVTNYKGSLQVVRLDQETREIEILGKGQDVRGKGSASMKLTGAVRALADGGTEVKSVSELNVVGMLAQLGARVISEVSNVLFQQFVANLQKQLEGSDETAAPPATAAPISALDLAASAAKGLFRR